MSKQIHKEIEPIDSLAGCLSDGCLLPPAANRKPLSRSILKLSGPVFVIVCVIAFGFSSAPAIHAQDTGASYAGISIDSSPQIFAVMCALDVAGYDSGPTPVDLPAEAALRTELVRMSGPSVDALRMFYRAHQLGDPGETLSRYMSFALIAGPEPMFSLQIGREVMPADVLSIDGFQDVLVNFYHDARLNEKWWSTQPERMREVERAEPEVRRVVLLTSSYLREIVKAQGSRTFTVFLEPLVGAETNFRNYGDHYYLVSGRAATLPLDQLRHAYLHFLLDTLPLANRKLVLQKDALLKMAALAPRLPDEYRNDFVGLFDECLIKAVELRLDKLSPEKLEAALHEDDADGFILVRPLVQQLQKFEKAEPAMDLYFPDLVAGVDLRAEQKRLRNFTFNPPEDVSIQHQQPAPAPQPVSDVDSLLTEGDRQIAAQNGQAAVTIFERVLREKPGEPRAIYGLAIASILTGDGDTAKDLFQKIVTASERQGPQSTTLITPDILAWSHVYLGRIHDVEGDRELAVKEYQAAVSVSGAPAEAIAAARQGTQRSYPTPGGGAANEQGDGKP